MIEQTQAFRRAAETAETSPTTPNLRLPLSRASSPLAES